MTRAWVPNGGSGKKRKYAGRSLIGRLARRVIKWIEYHEAVTA